MLPVGGKKYTRSVYSSVIECSARLSGAVFEFQNFFLDGIINETEQSEASACYKALEFTERV